MGDIEGASCGEAVDVREDRESEKTSSPDRVVLGIESLGLELDATLSAGSP